MALSKQRLITINKSTPSDLSYYTHLFTANTTAWSNMASDGSDVRFFDNIGNPLYHYVIPINDARSTIKDAATIFCVLVPTVYGSGTDSGNTLVYMRYGDTLANAESGSQTFRDGVTGIFDDFLVGADTAINSSRWPTLNGTWIEKTATPNHLYNVANGTIYYASSAQTFDITNGIRVAARLKGKTYAFSATTWHQIDWGTYSFGSNYSGGNYYLYVMKAGVTQAQTVFNWGNDTWRSLVFTIDSTATLKINIPGVSEVSWTDPAPLTGSSVIKINHSNPTTLGYIYLDYIGVAAYDPAVTTSVGAEVNIGPVITSVTPARTYDGASRDVQVIGTGFDSGAQVTLLHGAETVTCTGEVVTGTTQIDCSAPFTGATLGYYDCKVTNP